MKELSTTTLATELRNIEEQIEALETTRLAIREDLLNRLKQQGVRSVKLDNGDQYIRAERAALIIKDGPKAWSFAEEHHAMKMDTAKILKIIKPSLKIPKFFEIGYTEYLRIMRRGHSQAPEVDGEIST